VLAVRVHEQLLAAQKLPPRLVTKKIWKHRFEDIRSFERYLARNGTLILKFFLARVEGRAGEAFPRAAGRPGQELEIRPRDVRERAYWNEYMVAYEDAIRQTAEDPRAMVRRACRQQVVHARRGSRGDHPRLLSLDLHYPKVDDAKKAELAAARAELSGHARGARAPRRGG